MTVSCELPARTMLPLTVSTPFVIVSAADPERLMLPVTSQSPARLIALAEEVRPEAGQTPLLTLPFPVPQAGKHKTKHKTKHETISASYPSPDCDSLIDRRTCSMQVRLMQHRSPDRVLTTVCVLVPSVCSAAPP